MKRFFFDTPDGQIHYYMAGSEEPPIILIHQTPRSSDEYISTMPILAKKRRVIAMDTIGYGNSDKPPKRYRIEDYAKTVIMLLDNLGINKAVVVGHHTGSKTAVEVAAAYPERVDKLVLVGPYYWKDEERKLGISQVGAWAEEEIKADGSHLMNIWQASMRKLEGHLDIVNRRVVDNLKAGVESAHRGHWASASYKQGERLPLIKAPTLIIWGTKDIEWHIELGLHKGNIDKEIPKCRVVEIQGGGRELPSEMPEEFAHVIFNFIL